MKTPNQRSFRIAVLGAIVSAFLIGIGPVEGMMFPVANNYVIISETVNGNDLNINLTFEKIRDCHFDSRDWYVYYDERLKDRFDIDELSPKFSRPIGSYSVHWVIKGAANYAGHKMEVVTEHHCWWSVLWPTRTVNNVERITP